MAAWELQLHEDHGVGPGDGVLHVAEVILQGLALVPTELPLPLAPPAFVTQREDVVAEGRDGKLGALIRQVGGGADHCEGSLKTGSGSLCV